MRNELMARLEAAQNEIEHTDIMTGSAFMSDEALLKHVERYEKVAAFVVENIKGREMSESVTGGFPMVSR